MDTREDSPLPKLNHMGLLSSVGNESLEMESRFESRITDVKSQVKLSHFVLTTRAKSSLFAQRLESTRIFPTFMANV